MIRTTKRCQLQFSINQHNPELFLSTPPPNSSRKIPRGPAWLISESFVFISEVVDLCDPRRAIFDGPCCGHAMDEPRGHNAAAVSRLLDTRSPLLLSLVRSRGRGRGLLARNHLKWFARSQRAAH